jgi:hypothetical protein
MGTKALTAIRLNLADNLLYAAAPSGKPTVGIMGAGLDAIAGSAGSEGPGAATPGSNVTNNGTVRAGRKLKIIFGTDNRFQVSGNPVGYPYRAVGRVLACRNGGCSQCSGALIGPRAVLTAGHCVHSGGPNGNWLTALSSVTFAPAEACRDAACSSVVRPYGAITATGITTYTAWTQSGDFRCVISLPALQAAAVTWLRCAGQGMSRMQAGSSEYCSCPN